MSKNEISKSEIEEIVKLYNDGFNLTKISKRIGYSRFIVTSCLKKMGIYNQTKTKRNSVSKKELTKENINLIIELWNNSNSTEEIGKFFNCNRSTIRDILIENNIDTTRKSYNFQKYEHNIDFFKDINTEEKAYWLGFIVADGHVSSSAIHVNLEINDEEHLMKMKNDLETNAPVLKYIKQEVRENHNKKEYVICSLTICSSSICKDLIAMGLNNRKSWNIDVKKITNNIPKHLMHHFIRGIFDGDGCIGIYNQSRGTGKLYNFSIVGVKELMEFIKEELQIKTTLRFDNRTLSTYILKCGDKNELLRIRTILYSDATIYLTRKYNKFYSL